MNQRNAFVAGCERLGAAAAGKFVLTVIHPPAMAAWLAAAAAGDAEAAALVGAVGEFLARCAADGTLCVRCPRPLTAVPGAIVLVRVEHDAVEVLTFGYCKKCARTRTDRTLGTLSIRILRGIWPDIRELAAAPAGHA